jgi:hypothetical protein
LINLTQEFLGHLKVVKLKPRKALSYLKDACK